VGLVLKTNDCFLKPQNNFLSVFFYRFDVLMLKIEKIYKKYCFDIFSSEKNFEKYHAP
jgi:hypothetical protein